MALKIPFVYDFIIDRKQKSNKIMKMHMF